MSLGDWIIIGVLAVCFVLALVSGKKHGGCSGACSGCPHSGECHKK